MEDYDKTYDTAFGKESMDKVEDIKEEIKIEPKKVIKKKVVKAAPVPATKTFFDFTYPCSHPGDGHCVECYDKAKGI